MADAIIAQGETDWRTVVKQLVKKPAQGVFYQKHITTHWLEHYAVEWLDHLTNVFLIRQPEPVVASYAIKRDALTTADLGYSQQAALFELIRQRTGQNPIVVDSQRFLENPKEQLQLLCAKLDIEFDQAMLSWPQGSRESDGMWESHWYDSVKRSTGFGPARKHVPELDEQQHNIATRCQPYYEALAAYAL